MQNASQLTPFPGKTHLLSTPLGLIHVQEYGENTHPMLVAIHGWADTLERSPRLIAGLAPHFHLYTIMLPGYGRSSETRQAQSLAHLERWVEEGMKALGLTAPHLLGYSLGTEILGLFLEKHPDYEGRVVFAGAPLSKTEKPWWFRILKLPGTKFLARAIPLFRTIFIAAAIRSTRKLGQKPTKPLSRLSIRDATPRAIFDTMVAALGHFPRADRLHHPITFIYGELDILKPDNIPAPHTLVTIPQAGHILIYEAPEVTAEAVTYNLRA